MRSRVSLVFSHKFSYETTNVSRSLDNFLTLSIKLINIGILLITERGTFFLLPDSLLEKAIPRGSRSIIITFHFFCLTNSSAISTHFVLSTTIDLFVLFLYISKIKGQVDNNPHEHLIGGASNFPQ